MPDKLHLYSLTDEHFKLAVDAAPNSMIITNSEGQIVLSNIQTEVIFGYTKDELLGQPIEILIPQKYRGHHPEQRQEFTHAPSARKMGVGRELFGLHKNQSEIPVEVGLTPVKMKDGLYIICAIVDITERKKIETIVLNKSEELVRSNKELEQFAYVTSHDLQAPLRHITSYAQLLEKHLEDKLDSKAKQMMEFIVSGAQRMQQLINGLLSFSRVNRDKSKFKKINLNDILNDSLKNLEVIIRESKMKLEIEPLPEVTVDYQLIVNLFQNLIENASKFKKPDQKPIVKIYSHVKKNFAYITVEDNGIGIQPEYKDKIFLIFQRLHNSEEYPGTGLGLAICKKIVQFHGGEIWIDSQLNKGTAFHFTLPINSI